MISELRHESIGEATRRGESALCKLFALEPAVYKIYWQSWHSSVLQINPAVLLSKGYFYEPAHQHITKVMFDILK